MKIYQMKKTEECNEIHKNNDNIEKDNANNEVINDASSTNGMISSIQVHVITRSSKPIDKNRFCMFHLEPNKENQNKSNDREVIILPIAIDKFSSATKHVNDNRISFMKTYSLKKGKERLEIK